MDEIWAYPNELDALYAGEVVEFETEATACEFTDYTLMQSWIRGLP